MTNPPPPTNTNLFAGMAAAFAKTRTPGAINHTAWLHARLDDLAHEIAHAKNRDLRHFHIREIIDIADHVGVPAHGTRAAILNRIREHVLATEAAP